jgi:hypothetical protein
MVKKEAVKTLKYKDLTTETRRKWNAKSNVISAVIRATGTTSKSLRKYLSNIRDSTKSKNYRKQSYWARHTYFRNTNVKVKYSNLTLELELYEPRTVTTE